MDMNGHFINQFPELNPSMLEDFNTADFSVVETLLSHQQQPVVQAASFTSNLSSTSHINGFNAAQYFHTIPSAKDACHESKKRKVMELSKNSSSSAIDLKEDTRTQKKKNSLGRGKKAGMSNDKEVDMAQEVIHVRSRRGKATDSHSLAERVRREKINYKLRCLQELVPGCYKTMGMAVMLDEIINYVQSLQNQVEFLSMELAAASSFYDLNMEKEAIRNVQGTSTHDTQEIEKLARRGYGGHICFL